jgi:membrane fusion protein (multidrug efflux system)
VRRYLPVLGVVAIVAGLALVKVAQIQLLIGTGKAAQAAGPPPEYVSTARAQEEHWESLLRAVGSVATVRGVTVSSEVPGVVAAIHFESGATVKKGDRLLELDANVERAQLAASSARRALAATTLARTETLVRTGSLPATQLESDRSAFAVASADVATLTAEIERKIVRAPFDGRLGIRAVNLGQYLNAGAPITDLESADAQYVDFTLPQQHLALVKLGAPVRLAIRGIVGLVGGTVGAVDPTIDPVARAISVRASTTDTLHALRPGMFVDVAVVLPSTHGVITLPATALVHASYGDSVFVVEPRAGPGGAPAKFVRQQFVRAGEMRGDFVAIEQGVQAGEEVVVAGAFKLRNGARVEVDDRVAPRASADPRPENR